VDLEEAIGLASQAVSSTPDNHPDQVGRVYNLASMLESRYRRMLEMADLEEASGRSFKTLGTVRWLLPSTALKPLLAV
jgi:hypothetical protein